MEGPHDWKHLEYLLCSSRGLPPVSSSEGDLGNLLPCAEAVVDGATPKALLPEAWMNAAAEVRLQMETSLADVFRDREVCRDGECRRNTAQGEASLTVSSEVEATSFRGGLCMFVFLRQRCNLLSWSVVSIPEICQKCDESQAFVGVSLNYLGE